MIPLPLRPITLAHYAGAIATLAEAAQHPTSGGRAAAQVLLGAYNGDAFHLDVIDLCLLDEENLAAAFVVLQGRATLGREPHKCIEDGQRVFQEIWDVWEHLRVDRRYAEHYAEKTE